MIGAASVREVLYKSAETLEFRKATDTSAAQTEAPCYIGAEAGHRYEVSDDSLFQVALHRS